MKDSRTDELEILREATRRRAANGSLIDFIYYTNKDYKANWHHKEIARQIEEFIKSEDQKNLMLFVPPQHGKSEISTRNTPAFALGLNPDLKIVICSYSSDLATSFNRDIQRIIDGEDYADIFPETKINSKNVVTTQIWLRNSEIFEVVGRKGFVKAVGVGAGLTGRPADLAIIDDPIKDDMEASSLTIRNNVWNWYLSVLSTRLNNKSKQILIMTRWHYDDLAGRLLSPDYNPHWKDWKVIKFKAISEEKLDYDPRGIGEALWPDMHSLNKLTKLKDMNESTFASLYQQEPVIKGGNKVKTEWFTFADYCPDNLTVDLWIDGAYTTKTTNDPTGVLITSFDELKNKLYILGAIEKYLGMPELLKEIPIIADTFKARVNSRVFIEPKASGKSLKQLISNYTNLPAIEINNYLVNEGKDARLNVAAPYIEAGNVVLIKGAWNHKVINQLISFPKGLHDEFVDLMGYACFYYFKPNTVRFWENAIASDNLV